MRSPILALRQKKADLTKSAKAVLKAAEEAGRDLTEAEQQNHEKILKALDANEAQLVVEEQRLAEERGMIGSPDEDAAFAMLAHGQMPPENPGTTRRRTIGQIGIKSYAELFGPARGNGGFGSMQEFVRAVRFSGQSFDPRLRMSMTDADPTTSGFLVPETWAQEILNYALESSLIMPRARVFPLSQGESLKIPAVKDDDHSAGALYGGIVEHWYGELEDIDESEMKARLLQLTANKLGMLASASSELTEDSAQFENILTANLQAAASFFLDKNFLFGSGVAKPKGMLDPSNAALVVVDKNTNTPAGGFLFEDAVAMYSAHAPACRGRAIWIFSNDLLPALSVMQVVVRDPSTGKPVGGSATPVFTLNADGTGTLLGRPAFFTEKMKTAGTQGDCALICPDQYAVLLRREFQLRRSLDAGFKNDSIWWRLTCRVDGQPLWANTLTLTNSQVVSPFVVLQTRS